MESSEIEKLRKQDTEVLSALFADLAPRLSRFVRNLNTTSPAELALDTDDIAMEVFSQTPALGSGESTSKSTTTKIVIVVFSLLLWVLLSSLALVQRGDIWRRDGRNG